MKRLFAMFLLMTFAATGVEARPDPRIKTVRYTDQAVFSLTGHLGFQTVIEFNDDEFIENVAIGDSASWQVTPNRRGDVLIVKPIALSPPTNMTVVTSLRRYIFSLEVANADVVKPAAMTFVLRFSYPEKPKPKAPPEAQASVAAATPSFADAAVNKRYSFEGSREIIPSRIFDDGRSTYFQWPARTPTPAIFLVDGDENESIINHGYVDDYIVVDRVAPLFALRLGERETLIFNDGYVPVDPGPDAPREREKQRGFFGKIFNGDDEGDG